jgi:hypothetical protein
VINPLWCPHDGRLIEPRGDEALAMQARYAGAIRDEPDLPPDVGSGLDVGEAALGMWSWARHPEFWLAMGLGAVVRLWRLDTAHFHFDQASMMMLAREAVLRHAVPVASIPSSIHTLNPPLSIYLLMPFALFGKDPFPAVVALALWNVLGVALCYSFALRYFERPVAAVGTLLFAVSPAAVNYSRFLWQQNYLPPLLVLWAMAVYAGCVRGRKGMLAPAVALLVLGALLHVTALLLVPALLAGVLLAPRLPRWRDYALAAGIVAALLAPTVVWEAVSGWSDLRILTSYLSIGAKLDLEVFFRFYEALGGTGVVQTSPGPFTAPHSLGGLKDLLITFVTQPAPGISRPYTALGPLYVALGLVASLLFAMGWLVLAQRIFAPAWALWRERPRGSFSPASITPGAAAAATWRKQLLTWSVAAWGQLRADADRRASLLLWLIVTLPLVLLIRHSTPIFTHYLIVLYPFAFLTMALGVVVLAEGAARLRWRPRARPAAIVGVFALVGVLIAGQTAQSLLYTVTIATGQFDALTAGYGYPLNAMEQADIRLAQLQRQTGTTTVFVAESGLPGVALDYMLVREHPDRVGFADSCLILPAPDPGPALVVAPGDTLAAETLATLPNAAHVANIPMAGNTPLAVYRVAGTLPSALPGETPIGPVAFQDTTGQGLRLDAVADAGAHLLQLRWTVLGYMPDGALPLSFRVQTRLVPAGGQSGHVRDFRDCEPTRWRAGETMFTWLPAPISWNAGIGAPPTSAAPAEALLIQAQESAASLAMPSLGPMRLLSAQVVRTPWMYLAPMTELGQPGQPAGAGHVAFGGVLVSKGDLTVL